MRTDLELEIQAQPDETTCGPTCLQAVYRYYGDAVPLERIIAETPRLPEGGTLGVSLGRHALGRGYRATIYTYNLFVFDPTWFRPGAPDIRSRLAAEAREKQGEKLRFACEQYLQFLEAGGVLCLEDLTRSLIREYLNRGIPILTGLNATYLYRSARVHGPRMEDDDIRGEAVGHFVVLSGYDRSAKTVIVADPYKANPYSPTHTYEIGIDRVICAVLLGIISYDANLLIVEKPAK